MYALLGYYVKREKYLVYQKFMWKELHKLIYSYFH